MKMPYDISGQGSPVVLVPGGLTGWTSWGPYAQVLSEKRKVIRVQVLSVMWGLEDQPLPDDYSMRTESEALGATLDSLGFTEPVDVVGWSFGGFVSLVFALDHPVRVRTLTLIEPPAYWVLRSNGKYDEMTRKDVDFFMSMKGDITEDMLDGFFVYGGFVEPGQSARDLPQWKSWVPMRQSLRNSRAVVQYTDDLSRLRNFKVPTLLVKGTGSAPRLHQIIQVLANHIPHSRLVEFPGRHAPHIVSMNDFMEELEWFQGET